MSEPTEAADQPVNTAGEIEPPIPNPDATEKPGDVPVDPETVSIPGETK